MFSPLSSSAPVPDDSVKDVGLSTFKADVIDASRDALVLVDFWSNGSAACKQLMPILEKAARESKGAVRLAKVDVAQNQPIAQQLGIQSVPSVFAFYQGRPVDAFAGALPEAEVKSWVGQLLGQLGIGGAEKAGLDTALKQAAELLVAGDRATAQAIYADILEMEPGNGPAYAGLARCALDAGDVAKARQMVDAASAEIAKDAAFVSVCAALELAEQAQQGAGQVGELEAKVAQHPDDHQARFDLALALYGAGRREEAVDQLLDIVKRARTWNEDMARKQLVKFFEAMGATDPLTLSARKRLSSVLFS